MRLCDWPGDKSSAAPYGGPDIDAIGAIGAGPRPDSDGDELRDDEELLFFTDPLNRDTDGDGIDDGTEVANSTDPLNPNEAAVVAPAPAPAQQAGDGEEEPANTPTDETAALAGLIAAAAAILIAAAMVRSGGSVSTDRARSEILDGAQAVEHLIDGQADTVTIDGRVYVRPPLQLPPNTGGVAYETMTVRGIEVIDPDKVAVVTAPTTLPTAAPDEEVTTVDTPGGVMIAEDEIKHIVDWGVRNQRPLADIQRDIDARNETLGGSGQVPLSNPPREVDLEYGGTVVLNSAEAHEYEVLRDDLDRHRAAAVAWGETLRLLSGRVVLVAAAHTNVLGRLAAGTDQLLGEVKRFNAAPAEIGARFGRPTWSSYDPGEHRTLAEAVEAWEQSPDGRRALEEINKVQIEYIENLQSMTATDPEGKTSWFNCTTEELEEIEKTQERHTRELRYLRHRTADLREMERRLAERIGRKWQGMDTVLRIIGYLSIPLVLIGVAVAIRSRLRERPLPGSTLVLTAGIGVAFLMMHDVLRGAEVSRPLGWLATAVGAVLGAVWAGRSRLRSVGGEVVAKGEAWYLAIWGLAVAAAQFSALGPSTGATSLGTYAVYLATGLMLGVNRGLWARLIRVRQQAVVASTICPHCGSAAGTGSCGSCGWRVLIPSNPAVG